MMDLAVIGMGVMGRALAENFASRGYHTAVWNRETKVAKAAADSYAKRYAHDPKAGQFRAFETLSELKAALKRPRIAIIMVTAGPAIDAIIKTFREFWEPGDILIDAGNSYYKDSIRRAEGLEGTGIEFVGMGVSGGEEGALKGPSIMPAASAKTYAVLKEMLEAISAKTDSGPCVTRLGTGGAGHFVKMVHNGIEYADMQLIAEIYHLLKDVYGAKAEALAEQFSAWSKGPLSSYLIDITADIFRTRDTKDETQYLVDDILDRAGQKGTGTWTVQAASELGVPIPAIAVAVDARSISNRWEARQAFAKSFASPVSSTTLLELDEAAQGMLEAAMLAAKLLAYQQGYHLIKVASDVHQWELDLSEISRIWKGGCIIRARFLDDMMKVFVRQPSLTLLIEDEETADRLRGLLPALRQVVALAVSHGIPVPVLSSSLAYFEQWRTARLPHNLLQAQRDFFGAHTFQRLSKPKGDFEHSTAWPDQEA